MVWWWQRIVHCRAESFYAVTSWQAGTAWLIQPLPSLVTRSVQKVGQLWQVVQSGRIWNSRTSHVVDMGGDTHWSPSDLCFIILDSLERSAFQYLWQPVLRTSVTLYPIWAVSGISSKFIACYCCFSQKRNGDGRTIFRSGLPPPEQSRLEFGGDG